MNFLSRINYMKWAKVWVGISLTLVVISLISVFGMGLNKGIDFTGGLMLDVQFEKRVTMDDVRNKVSESLGTANIQVQNAEVKGAEHPDATEFFIRTPELSDEAKAKLFKDLESLGTYKRISEDVVSASVSNELTAKALLAVAIASVLQIIYIGLRFQFKFGVTAVIALLHDAVITLGVVSIFRIQVNSSFIAAILTVIGYSMNDTVVVFDRIRENLQKRQKGESLADLTTRSIQEVVHRSIYTVVTVLIMLVAMLALGGDTIWDFNMALFIGITAGSYSSVFIAAALWLWWEEWDTKRKKAAAGTKAKPAKA